MTMNLVAIMRKFTCAFVWGANVAFIMTVGVFIHFVLLLNIRFNERFILKNSIDISKVGVLKSLRLFRSWLSHDATLPKHAGDLWSNVGGLIRMVSWMNQLACFEYEEPSCISLKKSGYQSLKQDLISHTSFDINGSNKLS